MAKLKHNHTGASGNQIADLGPSQCEFTPKPKGMDYKKWYREIYLLSPHWRELRNRAIKYHGKFCRGCGSRDRLDVHHLNYRKIHDVTLHDLQILCRSCHTIEHNPVETKTVLITPKQNQVAKKKTKKERNRARKRPDSVELTFKILKEIKYKGQLSVLGVPFPPPKDWMVKLIGVKIGVDKCKCLIRATHGPCFSFKSIQKKKPIVNTHAVRRTTTPEPPLPVTSSTPL